MSVKKHKNNKKRSAHSTSRPVYGPQSFQGLRIGVDPSRPSLRNVIHEDSYKERKRRRRATEGKTFGDMKRQTRDKLKQAMQPDKIVVLNFRVKDFQKERTRGNIPMRDSKPFQALCEVAIHLNAADGARLVVDLDSVVVLCYLPGYISTGLVERMLQALDSLVELAPPPSDEGCNDRRATKGAGVASSPPLTENGEAPNAGNQGEWLLDQYQEPTREFVFKDAKQCAPDDSHERFKPLPHLDSRVLPPSALNLSPGWFPTGMENRDPVTPSSHLQYILGERSIEAAKNFLESKRLLDYQLDDLLTLLHPSLADDLRRLRSTMQEMKGPTGEIVRNGWTSTFPCATLGFNRTVTRHRDSKGVRGGMDFIGVLGRFKGGELKFPDLNLSVDWLPGCFGAFDGYDFTHEVAPWHGECRVTVISFLRKSTWSGLGVRLSPSAPMLPQLSEALLQSNQQRQALLNSSFKPKTDDSQCGQTQRKD